MKKFTFLLMLILTCLLACGMLASCSGDNATASSTTPSSLGSTVDKQAQDGGEYCIHSFGEWIVLKNASCTDKGLQERFCHYCDARITMEIEALGHTLTEATCTAPSTCTVCNAVEGVMLAHSPVKIPAVKQTCTKEGLTEGTMCKVCETVLVEQVAIPCHTRVKLPAVEATCESTGLTEGEKCSVCNEILIAQIEVPSHTPVFVKRVEPTCEQDGYTQGYECKDCKATISGKTPIPMTGHNYVDGKCTVCKSEEPAQDTPVTGEE